MLYSHKELKCVSLGFTLIELLVVVLIIGILAAIALPQYQRAVYKSRAAQLQQTLRDYVQAQNRYFLITNSYATDFNNLDIEFKGLPLTTAPNDASWASILSLRANNNMKLLYSSYGMRFLSLFLTGKYKEAGFVFFPKGWTAAITANRMYCVEAMAMVSNAGFCTKVMGITSAPITVDGARYYPM
jgi:prepilin-type N-terminal cleavage/methylation domain-containing protein